MSVLNAVILPLLAILQATWDVPPEVIFAIFTYPDNTAIFRDIQRVGGRKVIKAEPGFKVVEIEQLGELKVRVMHDCMHSTWA